MIHIETTTLKEHKDYDKMCTTVEIEGEGTIIKEEIKTLLQRGKENKQLGTIIISAISEVLHDN